MKIVLILAAHIMFAASLAQAQLAETPQPVSKTATAAPSVERVEVIGTRIKRLTTEGPSAVKTFKKEALEDSPNTTVSDTLRDSNIASFGVGRESAGGSGAATSTIGLRGLGSDKTLVLLNGHRLPRDPSFQSVDLNLIPQSAVERIEVLKDGSSALYGSDALGGVINIVTKKGFVGNEVSVKHTNPGKPGGAATEVSLVSGSSSENSNLMTILSYSHTDKIFGKDRAVTAEGLSSNSIYPSYFDDNTGKWVTPEPGRSACLAAGLLRTTSNGGERCYFKFNALASTRPEINQINYLTEYDYRINSNVKFYNRNLVVFKDVNWNYAPLPIASQPGFGENGTGTVSSTRFTSRAAAAGNRNNQDTERNYSTLLGLKGNFTDTWEYDFSAGYSKIQRQELGVSGYIDADVIAANIANGSYDPFANDPNKLVVNNAVVQPYQISKTNLFTVDLNINGEIGEISGGPISTAAGISAMNEKLFQQTDSKSAAGKVLGNAGSNDNGGRDVFSAYAEFDFPITAAFDVNIAGRVDKYSDFGTTFNPKIAAKYAVDKTTLLRASLGTGFKAPTLSELYSAESQGYSTFIDRGSTGCRNSGDCQQVEVFTKGGGNPKLKEEKALTGGIGVVYEPNADYNLSLDLWYTKIKNVVGLNLEDLTQVEGNDPSAPQKYGVTVIRDGNGDLSEIDAPNLNLQTNELSGLDLNSELTLISNIAGYRLSLNEDLSYFLFYRTEGFPGAGFRDNLGEYGTPRWRNTASLNFKNNTFTYSLTLRSVPEQNVIDRFADEKINPLNEIDFGFAYKVTKGSAFTFGVKNIFDTDQPVDANGGIGGAPDVNTGLYDVNGRIFSAGYTQKF